MMSEEAREARRQYKRKWNKEHPDLVRAAQERYWIRKAAAAIANKGKADGTAEKETTGPQNPF